MKRFQGLCGRIALAMLCAGVSGAARSENLAIQSFSASGRIAFGELSTATTYRVDWARAATGVWHTAWPGVFGLEARGHGSCVATVGVANASCFYRVVASVTNAAPPGPGSDYLVVDLSGGPLAQTYTVSYLGAVPVGGWTDEYKTTRMVFRRIPAGNFMMGSPEDEEGRWFDEGQHPVALSQDFYIGVFEVTQRQWERVMGNWPGYFNNAGCRETRPVESVSYNDIRGSGAGAAWPANGNVDIGSFLGALRARTGTNADLPTEAQWEYVCRSGTIAPLNSGYSVTNDCDSHLDAVGRYWYNEGAVYPDPNVTTAAGTAQAGFYQPNAWGLHDLHGNVSEWCLDWYNVYLDTVTDPKGPADPIAEMPFRVCRGGDCLDTAYLCRSAARDGYAADSRTFNVGFRVVLPAPGP